MSEFGLIGTTDKILKSKEKESLRKFADKITKVPDKINIPTEYLVGEEWKKKKQ